MRRLTFSIGLLAIATTASAQWKCIEFKNEDDSKIRRASSSSDRVAVLVENHENKDHLVAMIAPFSRIAYRNSRCKLNWKGNIARNVCDCIISWNG